MKAQFAIMRFAKYKGPEIGQIEAHNERTKETYASNPDIDTSRSKNNYHLITPARAYREESNCQIAAAKCRTRKDSIRLVEVLFTASPAFFKGKKPAEQRAFFEESLKFIQSRQSPDTFVSAVIHMDEKTPHMHVTFVPLTKDGRLSAKDIVGNKAKLTKWQDAYWKHMVKKWPDLERGESASKTGRDHIPPRLYKEAAHLSAQFDAIQKTISQINMLNSKLKSAEAAKLLDAFAPKFEDYQTQCRKYVKRIKELEDANQRLAREADASKRKSVREQLEISAELAAFDNLRRRVEQYAPELLNDAKVKKKSLER